MEEAVRRVLDDAVDVTITALPDGSVDHRYQVLDTSGRPITRDAFADQLAAGARTFMLEQLSTEPGGMAVNAALQTHALGAQSRLVGHLDHDVFHDLPVESASMGPPADVKIYDFEEHAVMLTDESDALREWTLRDVRRTLGDRFEAWFAADAVVCSNWSSLPNMTGAFEDLANSDISGNWFLVDPGDVTMRPAADIEDFVEALGALSASFDVALNPNDTELAAIGDALDVTAPSTTGLLERIRDATAITAVAVHAAPEAAVATARETVRVPNYDTRGPARFTGGGDHFTGGLAVALGAGASWQTALLVGNACATHFVVSGETGTEGDLRGFPHLDPFDKQRE